MYCREGQQTEEDMYNNEEGGPAFNEFLELIGQKVRLKGFNKYKAGLCSKSKISESHLNSQQCLGYFVRFDCFIRFLQILVLLCSKDNLVFNLSKGLTN
jgi:hypothetical protein